jgi:hypothetical protein
MKAFAKANPVANSSTVTRSRPNDGKRSQAKEQKHGGTNKVGNWARGRQSELFV